MTAEYERMSRAQLVEELRLLRADPRVRDSLVETERLLHEVQVHQLELEMQNRELRDAQHLLEESRSWYAELFDLAPVGYCTLDSSGRIQEANLAAIGLLRMERERLVGRVLGTIVSPGYEQTWHEHLQACVRAGGRASHEIAFSVRGRGPVMMRVVSAPSIRADASAAGCRTTLVDISASKESENMLRFLAEASAVLSSSLEYSATLPAVARLAVPVVADICCIDLFEGDTEVRRLEVAFADKAKNDLLDRVRSSAPTRLGETPQAQVLRSGRSLLFAQPAERPAGASEAERACDPTSLMYVPLITRDRTFGVLTLMMAQSGRRYSAKELALAEDIARRAAMAIDNADLYRKAREASNARDDILEMVSHDLRNPLNGIMMAMQMALRHLPTSAEQTERMMQQVLRAGTQMNRMLDDLVDVSSIEAGRFYLDRGDHVLDELIEESVNSFSADAARRGQSLLAEPSSAHLRVTCDRMRVLQVLGNLIVNAIKFTPPGGSITLRAELRANQACVSVRDTGPGIPSARLPRLFERYYQADETAGLGRGLGLYIARRLIEAQHGTIWAESVAGAGSTFSFTLPLAVGPAEQPAGAVRGRLSAGDEDPSLILASSGASDRIMIVDDESELREAMSAVLQAEGYQVVQAANGVEALDYLDSGNPLPVAMLVDVHMPAMDGPGLIAALRRNESLKHIPVCLISSTTSAELKRLAAYLGVATYLRKPIQAESLCDVIRCVRTDSKSQRGSA